MTDERKHPSDEWLLRSIDSELAADHEASLRTHLAGCEECRGRLSEMERVSRALCAVGELLESSCRERRTKLVAVLESEPVVAGEARYGWLTIAAAMVVAAGIWLMQSAKVPVGAKHEAVNSSFIALPYSDGSLDPEGAVVLQVEVPRTAMVLAGMAAGDVPADGRVKAEVLVGADGLARGIRFID